MKRGKGYSGDSDDDYMADEPEPRSNGTGRQARRTMVAQTPRSAGRSRPTNNQLLYKAYFRWNHYSHKLRNGTAHLPTETDACPSVTAAFLQVLHTLNLAEGYRIGEQRNILQILSNNTRRTKVVELSTGTHRVPDELRKHYLSDGEGGQYSTNLDRNRYGNDDQYLFTVIRYDLEYLGLCPCMVDVEIIDAKNDNQSIFVSAGQEACMCTKMPGFMHDTAYAMQQFASRSRGGVPPIPGLAAPDIAAAAALPGTSRGEGGGSPKRSGSQVSLAFDALVMAATGGTEGAAAAQAGGEAPVESRLGGPVAGLQTGGVGPAAAAAAVAAVAGRGSGAGMHQLPSRQRSRLWSALSYGDVDSLQNALDAFRAEEEIASGPGLSDALAGAVAASAGAAPTSSESFRKRSRKPMRGPSASNLAAQMDMLAGMSGMDANLFNSLVKSTGLASGLRERSGDNTAAQGDVVSSGAVQDGVPRRSSSAGPGRSTGSQPPQQQQRSGPLAAGGSGLRGAGDHIEEAVSQEDDSEPVTGSGRKSSSGGGRGVSGKLAGISGGAAGNADDPAAAAAGDEADGYDVTAQELGFGVGQVGEVGEDEGEMEEGAGDMMGDDGDGTMADCGPPPGPFAPRRVRHVPRQSSAINLATRVGPAELKRMAAEVEALRAENRLLRQQVGSAAAAAAAAGYAAEGGDGAMQSVLQREVAAMRQQLQEALHAKAAAEDKVMQLQQELIQTRNTANQIVTHAIFNKDASTLSAARPPNGLQAAAGAGVFGAPQGAGFNPLAALSGQFQSILAGACPGNPAAAAAAMAAAMAAAAAASGNTAAMPSSSGTIAEEMVGLEGKLQQQDANAAAAVQAVLAAAAAAGGRGSLQPKAEQSCVASHAEPIGCSDDCKAAADCAAGPAALGTDQQVRLKADAAEVAAAVAALDAQCSAPAGGAAELAAAAAAAAEAEAAAAAAGVGESRADLSAAVGMGAIMHEALPIAAMETA